MPRFKRIFVLERGEVAFLQDEDGNSMIFNSIKDLNRCTGLDFTGKFYIGYEPDIKFYEDSEDPSKSFDSSYPEPEYEAMIDNIAVLESRKADITYGLTGQELADAQAEQQKIVEQEARVASLESERESDGLGKYTPDQVREFIETRLDLTDFDAAVTNAELKSAIRSYLVQNRNILKRLALYTLRY
jgi:hypothetical protein